MKIIAGGMNQYENMFSFGKRHVARPDHERDQEVAERPGQERDDHEEDHDRRVHREQLVVELRRHLVAERGVGPEQPAQDRHRLPGPGQLPADGHRQQAAEHEEDQAREQELDADDLVIGREDVLGQEVARGRMNMVVAVAVARDRGHDRRRRVTVRPARLDGPL